MKVNYNFKKIIEVLNHFMMANECFLILNYEFRKFYVRDIKGQITMSIVECTGPKFNNITTLPLTLIMIRTRICD